MGHNIRDQQREASELLDRAWDPIGVYQGSRDEQAPPGEYDTYAGWIVNALLPVVGRRRSFDRCSQRVKPWG
jgi:hypothetical protein